MRLKKRIILITLFVGFLFIGSLSTPFLAQAQKFKPQITIPGSSFAKGASISMGGDTTILGLYIAALYKYAISIVGIVATIMLMFGGFTWLTAGGSGEKVGKARDIIFGALTGLVLALTSYTMLTLINPDLVNFRVLRIQKANIPPSGENNSSLVSQEIGCCLVQVTPSLPGGAFDSCTLLTKSDCDTPLYHMWRMGNTCTKDSSFNESVGAQKCKEVFPPISTGSNHETLINGVEIDGFDIN